MNMVNTAVVTTEGRIVFTLLPVPSLERIRQTMANAKPNDVVQLDVDGKLILAKPNNIYLAYGVKE